MQAQQISSFKNYTKNKATAQNLLFLIIHSIKQHLYVVLIGAFGTINPLFLLRINKKNIFCTFIYFLFIQTLLEAGI